MKLQEICEGNRTIYTNNCLCGNLFEVRTQRDNFPEYETAVYVKCDCGEYVEFILPVN